MRIPLSKPFANQLTRRIRTIWGVNDTYYWYPLSTSRRFDVIAFDSDYIEDVDQKNRRNPAMDTGPRDGTNI